MNGFALLALQAAVRWSGGCAWRRPRCFRRFCLHTRTAELRLHSLIDDLPGNVLLYHRYFGWRLLILLGHLLLQVQLLNVHLLLNRLNLPLLSHLPLVLQHHDLLLLRVDCVVNLQGTGRRLILISEIEARRRERSAVLQHLLLNLLWHIINRRHVRRCLALKLIIGHWGINLLTKCECLLLMDERFVLRPHLLVDFLLFERLELLLKPRT